MTVFERPCEKLWRTCPVSTLLRSSSLPPVRVRVRGRFCSCSFALVISIKHHHLLSRTPSGLHGEVYQCFRPKAGDLLCNANYATTQGAPSDRNIYHMIAAKNRAHL